MNNNVTWNELFWVFIGGVFVSTFPNFSVVAGVIILVGCLTWLKKN